MGPPLRPGSGKDDRQETQDRTKTIRDMGKDRFDFSEIDAALPAAERMQEKDRLTDTLENNYKAVGILSDRVEKLEGRLSEVLPGLDEAVSSLREANKITISEEARRTLEQEGEAVCRNVVIRRP